MGTFFGDEKTSIDGSYRSVSVALRDGNVENLCDTETPVSPGNPEYVMIGPGMANMPLSVTATLRRDRASHSWDTTGRTFWKEATHFPTRQKIWFP